MIDLAALLEDPRLAIELPPEAVAPLLVQCAALQGILATRLATVPASSQPAMESAAMDTDRWLSVEEVDEISHLGKQWLYRNWRQVPGAKKFSPKRLRFLEATFRRWLAKRT